MGENLRWFAASHGQHAIRRATRLALTLPHGSPLRRSSPQQTVMIAYVRRITLAPAALVLALVAAPLTTASLAAQSSVDAPSDADRPVHGQYRFSAEALQRYSRAIHAIAAVARRDNFYLPIELIRDSELHSAVLRALANTGMSLKEYKDFHQAMIEAEIVQSVTERMGAETATPLPPLILANINFVKQPRTKFEALSDDLDLVWRDGDELDGRGLARRATPRAKGGFTPPGLPTFRLPEGDRHDLP